MKYILFFLIIFSTSFSALSQEETENYNLANFNQEKIESIDVVKKNLIQTKALLNSKIAESTIEKDPKRKLMIEGEVKSITKRFDKLILNLISAVTNIKMDEI